MWSPQSDSDVNLAWLKFFGNINTPSRPRPGRHYLSVYVLNFLLLAEQMINVVCLRSLFVCFSFATNSKNLPQIIENCRQLENGEQPSYSHKCKHDLQKRHV